MNKNSMAGAVTRCDAGLCMIGSAMLLHNGKPLNFSAVTAIGTSAGLLGSSSYLQTRSSVPLPTATPRHADRQR